MLEFVFNVNINFFIYSYLVSVLSTVWRSVTHTSIDPGASLVQNTTKAFGSERQNLGKGGEMKGAGEAPFKPRIRVGSCLGRGRAHLHPSPAVRPQLQHWSSRGGLLCPTAHVRFSI